MFDKIKIINEINKINNIDEYNLLINKTIFKDFDDFSCNNKNLIPNKNKFATLINELSNNELEAIFDIHDPIIINENEINVKNNNVVEIKKITDLGVNLFNYFINLNKIHILNECNMNILNLGNIYIKNIKFDYYFNKDISILKYIVKLNSIIFNYHFNQEIHALKYLYNLQSLSFSYKFNQSLSPLSKLINLKHLRLGNEFNQLLDPITYLTNLKELKIYSDNFNSSIECLNNLKKLEILIIHSPKYTHSISVIEKLNNLKTLHIKKLASDPNSILTLKNLEDLRLIFFNRNIDLNFFFKHICNLVKLENLSIDNYNYNYNYNAEYNKNLKSLKFCLGNSTHILKLNKIERLYITHSNINNLKSITLNYNTLLDLTINGFDCYNYNYDFLDKLVNLKYLELNMQYLANIDFLSNLYKLQGLILNTNINNFSLEKLNKLQNLVCLSIFYNKSINLTNLSLPNLKYIFYNNFDYIDLNKYTIVSLSNDYLIFNKELITYNKFIEKIILEQACKYNNNEDIILYVNQIKNRLYI